MTDAARVDLGRKLFFDPRLSRSGFISCNSCHNLSMGGSDNITSSIGDRWQKGPINSPTVLNSRLNLAQFWDGRAKDLKEQAGGPIANPGEMAFTHDLAVDMLRSIPQYVAEFKAVFGHDKLTIDEVTSAIAAFEETLVTPNARRQVAAGRPGGDRCAGAARLRVVQEQWLHRLPQRPERRRRLVPEDGLIEAYKTTSTAEGRFAVTKQDIDRFYFKVPTLRNVELTYPYFHDGAADTLAQAVDAMGRLQLGRKFSEAEIADVVAFLKTLTGEQPRVVLPILPPSSDKTKRPQPFD